MEAWPELDYRQWKKTAATLHMWTQIVGKIRLALEPFQNHWWHVPLYVSLRGLTTSPMPYGDDFVEIELDFEEERCHVLRSGSLGRTIALRPRSVADFEAALFGALESLDVHVSIREKPVEVPHPIRFPDDQVHASYDADAARRFWRVLASTATVLNELRGRFVCKSSPPHFFWGSFDLAFTLFSGRRAPSPPADPIGREAYSHEVVSFGFWPGGITATGVVHEEAVFYAYAAPEPRGFADAPVRPAGARYDRRLGERILPYEVARRSGDPRAALLAFCESAYAAAATLGRWPRGDIEREARPG